MFCPVWLLVAAVLCLSLAGCSNEVTHTVAAVGQATVAAPKRAPPASKAASHEAPVQTREQPPFTVLAGGDGLAEHRLIVDLVTALERNRLRLRLGRSQGPEQDLRTILHNPGSMLRSSQRMPSSPCLAECERALVSTFATFFGFRASDCTS